jgi:N-acetylneuraminic acid mutarotase
MIQVGGLNYLIGGEQTYAKTTQAYSPLTNTWTTAPLLPAKRHHIQPVVVQGKIYVIGGLVQWPGPSVNTVYMLDTAHPELGWQTRAPLPTSRGALGCAALGVRIYCAGGLSSTANNTAINVMEVYNTVTNTWATLAPMPRPRDHFQAAIVDGRFYAISGRNTDVLAKYPNTDIYDIDTDTWFEGAPIPTPRGGFATAVMQGRIIIIGGEGNPALSSHVFPHVEEYDPQRDVWRRLTDIPTPRHGIGAAVSKVEENGLQERAYIASGAPHQGGAKSSVHEVFAYHTKNLICFAPGSTPGVYSGAMTADTQYTAGADDDPSLDNLTSPLLFANSTVNATSLGTDKVTYTVTWRCRATGICGAGSTIRARRRRRTRMRSTRRSTSSRR